MGLELCVKAKGNVEGRIFPVLYAQKTYAQSGYGFYNVAQSWDKACFPNGGQFIPRSSNDDLILEILEGLLSAPSKIKSIAAISNTEFLIG